LIAIKTGQELPVGCHEHFDVSTRVESIELSNDLKHGALDLVVTTGTIVKSRTANGVDLVEKDYASLLCSSQLKEFPNHAGTLTDVSTDINTYERQLDVARTLKRKQRTSESARNQ